MLFHALANIWVWSLCASIVFFVTSGIMLIVGLVMTAIKAPKAMGDGLDTMASSLQKGNTNNDTDVMVNFTTSGFKGFLRMSKGIFVPFFKNSIPALILSVFGLFFVILTIIGVVAKIYGA
jgi:hypothetical protein